MDLVVLVTGADGGDDGSHTCAAKTIFQKAGELGIPVWNMVIPLCGSLASTRLHVGVGGYLPVGMQMQHGALPSQTFSFWGLLPFGRDVGAMGECL